MSWNPTICRICLNSDSESNSLHAAVEHKTDSTYLDIFNSCTHLDARLDDNLPKTICHQCCKDLIASFNFLSKAVSSDQFFRNNTKYEKQVEYYFESDEDRYEEVEECIESSTKLDDFTHVEIDTEVFYEENLEYEDQSETEKLKMSVNDMNTFELVECGPEYLLEEDDVLTEEDDKKFSQLECDPKFVQYLDNEESVNEAKLSACKSMGSRSTNTTANCNICNKTLKKWSIRHHMKRCHKTEKLLLCSACPKTFTISSDLRVHMKTHDKERKRNFICTICRKGFYEKQALGVHMMRHEGVREFQCEKCPKKFITKKSLEVHEFVHNRQNGRFVCRYCSKRFPSRADLIVHERFHTGDYPYKCELCNKSYAVKSHFNYHMAKHKGVTYKCDQCDKEFMNRGSLTAHKLKHRDKMPHECPICNKGFPSPFKLNRHKNYCQQPKKDVEIQ